MTAPNSLHSITDPELRREVEAQVGGREGEYVASLFLRVCNHFTQRLAQTAEERWQGTRWRQEGEEEKGEGERAGRGGGQIECKRPRTLEPQAPSAFTTALLPFSQPRKRLSLEVSTVGQIRLLSKEGVVERSWPAGSCKRIARLETPEKPKRHWSWVLWFTQKTEEGEDETVVGCVFSLPEAGCEAWKVNVAGGKEGKEEGIRSARWMDDQLHRLIQLPVITGDPEIFSARRRTPYARGQGKTGTSQFITCYYGSREGHLYLLPQGVFFGFRKPCFWLGKDTILGTRIQGVTSRTFNVVFCTGLEEEMMFEMLDHEEYDPLVGYLERMGISGMEGKEGKKGGEREARIKAEENGKDMEMMMEVDGEESEDEDFRVSGDEEEDSCAEEYDSATQSEGDEEEEGEEEEMEEEEVKEVKKEEKVKANHTITTAQTIPEMKVQRPEKSLSPSTAQRGNHKQGTLLGAFRTQTSPKRHTTISTAMMGHAQGKEDEDEPLFDDE